MFSLPALEHKLVVYISSENFNQPFDLEDIPVITKEESEAQALLTLKTAYTPDPIAKAATSKASVTESVMATSQNLTNALAQVPEFKDFGPVLKTSVTPIELTEKETEYAVTAHKHIFKDHIVLQVHSLTPSLNNSLLYQIRFRILFLRMYLCFQLLMMNISSKILLFRLQLSQMISLQQYMYPFPDPVQQALTRQISAMS
jgi:hypothetical protein